MNVDNENYEEIKVKEEIEDPSYDIKQESIEGDFSNIFIKQDCKLEVNWDCAEDEQLIYDENLEKWTSTNVNSTKSCYEDQIFQCPECSVKTKYEDNLNKHISFMHQKNKQLSNKPIQNKYRNAQNIFALHTASNKNDLLPQKENFLEKLNCFPVNKKQPLDKKNLFRCTDCFFHCRLKVDLIYHVYQNHYNKNNLQNKQSEIFVCPYCAKRYFHKQKKNHLAYCRRNGNNYLQCDHCSNYFKGKYILRMHIFKMHFKDGIFKELEDNMNQTKLLPCPRCGRRYENSSSLLKHVANCGKKYLFHCNTCLFTSNYEFSLVQHILKHLKKSNLCLDLKY